MAATNIYYSALLVIVALHNVVGDNPLVVQTDSGPIKGSRRVAADGTEYTSFRGVPYAKQPLGKLRFQELQPADRWEEPLDATAEGAVCPQDDTLLGNIPYASRVMSESCIYANIHVPDERPETGLPILVYIHGGAFFSGSGDSDQYGPEYLVSKGVIVITFNYRLNVFGFLSLGSSVLPGNNGIRDALTLLRWVKTNAASFGGNPDDVTVGGHNAGAAIAHYLSMADAAKGLFNKIILMSLTASPMFYSASPAYAKIATDTFLQSLGITSTDPEEIHSQLVEMPLEKLMAANKDVQNSNPVLINFAPVIETPSEDFTIMIDIDPDQMIKDGRGKDIPIIIGFTQLEAETYKPVYEAIGLLDLLNEKFASEVLFPKVALSSTRQQTDDYVAQIKETYFPQINLDNYATYITYGFQHYPAVDLARIRVEQGAAPTYMYIMMYNNENNVIRLLNHLGPYNGTANMEDLSYLMRVNTGLPAPQLGQPTVEDPMVDRFSTLISTFVKTSVPGDEGQWTPVSTDAMTYLALPTPDPQVYANTLLADFQWTIYKFFYRIEKGEEYVLTF